MLKYPFNFYLFYFHCHQEKNVHLHDSKRRTGHKSTIKDALETTETMQNKKNEKNK